MNSEYRSLVGALQYGAQMFFPRSSFAVSRLSMHLTEGTEAQLTQARQTLAYEAQHPLGILVRRQPTWSLVAYTDSDLANHPSAKSTSGMAILLNGTLIDWYARLQTTISFSTFEAEYTALSMCVRELLGIMNWLDDIGVPYSTPTVYCDQQKVVESCISGSILTSRRVRHLKIQFEHVVQQLAERRISLQWIESSRNIADAFTKALQPVTLGSLAGAMALVPVPVPEK